MNGGARDARLKIGAVIHDWQRGDLVVVGNLGPEDLGRFTDGLSWRGSTAERCALHGGQTRTQVFEVRD